MIRQNKFIESVNEQSGENTYEFTEQEDGVNCG